jgi:hypothetical protein
MGLDRDSSTAPRFEVGLLPMGKTPGRRNMGAEICKDRVELISQALSWPATDAGTETQRNDQRNYYVIHSKNTSRL